jgi:hypothetical protein
MAPAVELTIASQTAFFSTNSFTWRLASNYQSSPENSVMVGVKE